MSGPTSNDAQPEQSKPETISATNASATPTVIVPSKTVADILREIFVHAVVGLLSAGAAYAWGNLHEQKKIQEAPAQYVEELDKLINKAVADGPDSAVENAKAIVMVRNSLANSLSALGTQLDSQADVLAAEVGLPTLGILKIGTGTPSGPDSQGKSVKASKNAVIRKTPEGYVARIEVNASDPRSKEQVYSDIKILQKTWPAKRTQIQVELRKLLAELGLFGK